MPVDTVAELLQRGGGGHSGNGAPFGSGREWNDNPGTPQRVYVTGMILALGGILMFFMALISAWVVRRGFPNSDWQPIELPRVLWLNTLILAASSFTLARSRRCLIAGREADHRHWWGVTAALGAFFLVGQILAWRQMLATGLFLATNPASSFFYLFTAAHGLHVLGGIAVLLVVGLRSTRRLTLETATRVAALYWHFLGGLWLLILAILVVER